MIPKTAVLYSGHPGKRLFGEPKGAVPVRISRAKILKTVTPLALAKSVTRKWRRITLPEASDAPGSTTLEVEPSCAPRCLRLTSQVRCSNFKWRRRTCCCRLRQSTHTAPSCPRRRSSGSPEHSSRLPNLWLSFLASSLSPGVPQLQPKWHKHRSWHK